MQNAVFVIRIKISVAITEVEIKRNMSQHVHSIFYKNETLTTDQYRHLLIDAKSKAYYWQVDQLDCSISWSRQRIDMTFLEIMALFAADSQLFIVHRRGYEPKDQSNADDIWRWFLDIGFTARKGSVSYYLWLKLEQDLLQSFISKYGLEPYT